MLGAAEALVASVSLRLSALPVRFVLVVEVSTAQVDSENVEVSIPARSNKVVESGEVCMVSEVLACFASLDGEADVGRLDFSWAPSTLSIDVKDSFDALSVDVIGSCAKAGVALTSTSSVASSVWSPRASSS